MNDHHLKINQNIKEYNLSTPYDFYNDTCNNAIISWMKIILLEWHLVMMAKRDLFLAYKNGQRVSLDIAFQLSSFKDWEISFRWISIDSIYLTN